MKKLEKIGAWSKNTAYAAPRSAQGYLGVHGGIAMGSSCGSGCGAGGDTKPKRISGCGAGDDR